MMATVNFISYAAQSRAAMERVTSYVGRDDKTEEKRLVSGQSCSPQFAYQEFLATRNAYRKDSPVWFYHYTQSFSPNENVTGEQAHEIAKEFAAKAWPESEVLIATHTDAKHIHSHFVVNAVCHETGKMLRQGPHTLDHLRRLSDQLCADHGLSVLKSGKRKMAKGMSAREYRSAEKGESWKLRLMSVIDECMRRARSREDFIERMRREGYEVKWTDERANITYTTPQGMRCRDKKLHEEKYLKENMEDEFRIRKEIVDGRAEAAQRSSDDLASAVDAAYDRESDLDGAGRHIDRDGRFDSDRAPRDEHDARVAADEERRAGDAENAGTDARGDAASSGTGWEKEREAFLAYWPGGQEMAPGVVVSSADTVTGMADRRSTRSSGVSGVVLREPSDARHRADSSISDLAIRAAGQGLKAIAEADSIFDDDSEDEEERRRKIEAQEAAQNLGAVLGLAAGLAISAAEKRKQQEEAQRQNM